jgi:hypothetical protein
MQRSVQQKYNNNNKLFTNIYFLEKNFSFGMDEAYIIGE